MRKTPVLVGLYFVFGLYGCTLMQMRRESNEMEQRIPIKEQQLRAQEEQNKVIAEQKKQLESQRALIQAKQDELSATLDSLTKQNIRRKATTQAEIMKKKEVDKKIKRIQAEKASVTKDPGLSDEAKLRRIEELRKQAKALLEIPIGNQKSTH